MCIMLMVKYFLKTEQYISMHKQIVGKHFNFNKFFPHYISEKLKFKKLESK